MKLQLFLFVLNFVLTSSAEKNLILDYHLTNADHADFLHKLYYKPNNQVIRTLSKYKALDFLMIAQNATNSTNPCMKALAQLDADLIDEKYYALEGKANLFVIFRWLLRAVVC